MKHKPATPLPWETSTNQHQQWDVCAADAGDMVADLMGCDGQEQNAAYIAHAANAYPRLVVALQRIVNDGDALRGDEIAGWAAETLRELGEVQS